MRKNRRHLKNVSHMPSPAQIYGSPAILTLFNSGMEFATTLLTAKLNGIGMALSWGGGSSSGGGTSSGGDTDTSTDTEDEG